MKFSRTSFVMAPLTAVLLATQSAAEEARPGIDLMELGGQLLLRGIISEMAPAIDQIDEMGEEIDPRFRALIGEIGPVFADLLTSIDDVSNYAAPVILENGDILIRRLPQAPALRGIDPEAPDASNPDASNPDDSSPDDSSPNDSGPDENDPADITSGPIEL